MLCCSVAVYEGKEFSMRLDLLLLFPKQVAYVSFCAAWGSLFWEEENNRKTICWFFFPSVSKIVYLSLLHGWKYVTRKCVKTNLVLKYFLQGYSSSVFSAWCPVILSYLHTPSFEEVRATVCCSVTICPKVSKKTMWVGFLCVRFFFFNFILLWSGFQVASKMRKANVFL